MTRPCPCLREFLLCGCLLIVVEGFTTTKTRSNDRRKALACWASAETKTESEMKGMLQDALSKMAVVMSEEFYERDTTLKQFYSKIVKNIEIKESPIPQAGLGLFAKKPIKANTIVSLYPCHSLGIDRDSDFVFVSSSEDMAYFVENPSFRSIYLHCTDQPLFQRPSVLGQYDPTPLYLDVNPNRNLSDAWVSHFINDGATVGSNTEAGVLEYYQRSKIAKNCIHIPFGPSPILATVTTKKIKKGEELLTSYGGTYWLGVWLDVHGEEGVGVTPKIQSELQESARDLVTAMKSVATVYNNLIGTLHREFGKISK